MGAKSSKDEVIPGETRVAKCAESEDAAKELNLDIRQDTFITLEKEQVEVNDDQQEFKKSICVQAPQKAFTNDIQVKKERLEHVNNTAELVMEEEPIQERAHFVRNPFTRLWRMLDKKKRPQKHRLKRIKAEYEELFEEENIRNELKCNDEMLLPQIRVAEFGEMRQTADFQDNPDQPLDEEMLNTSFEHFSDSIMNINQLKHSRKVIPVEQVTDSNQYAIKIASATNTFLQPIRLKREYDKILPQIRIADFSVKRETLDLQLLPEKEIQFLDEEMLQTPFILQPCPDVESFSDYEITTKEPKQAWKVNDVKNVTDSNATSRKTTGATNFLQPIRMKMKIRETLDLQLPQVNRIQSSDEEMLYISLSSSEDEHFSDFQITIEQPKQSWKKTAVKKVFDLNQSSRKTTSVTETFQQPLRKKRAYRRRQTSEAHTVRPDRRSTSWYINKLFPPDIPIKKKKRKTRDTDFKYHCNIQCIPKRNEIITRKKSAQLKTKSLTMESMSKSSSKSLSKKQVPQIAKVLPKPIPVKREKNNIANEFKRKLQPEVRLKRLNLNKFKRIDATHYQLPKRTMCTSRNNQGNALSTSIDDIIQAHHKPFKIVLENIKEPNFFENEENKKREPLPATSIKAEAEMFEELQLAETFSPGLKILEAFSLNPLLRMRPSEFDEAHSYMVKQECIAIKNETEVSAVKAEIKIEMEELSAQSPNYAEFDDDSGIFDCDMSNRDVITEIALERALINFMLMQKGYSPAHFRLYNENEKLKIFLDYLLVK